jgi:hypothetical protein
MNICDFFLHISRLFSLGMKREVFETEDSHTCKGDVFVHSNTLYISLLLRSLLSRLNKTRVSVSSTVAVCVCI